MVEATIGWLRPSSESPAKTVSRNLPVNQRAKLTHRTGDIRPGFSRRPEGGICGLYFLGDGEEVVS